MLDISQKPFGTLDGRPVSLFTLSRPDGIRVSVSDYGCTIQSILVPDGDGWQQVVLGYDTLDEYRRGTQMFGATVGPTESPAPTRCHAESSAKQRLRRRRINGSSGDNRKAPCETARCALK